MSAPLALRPFFGYFGSKWRLALRYPSPAHGTIVEPFAGSAGYSLRYWDRNVMLIEREPRICALWRYLIEADPNRILALPDEGGDLSEPEETLRGLWFAKAPTAQRSKPSAWAKNPKYVGSSWWGPKVRERIAAQLNHIRHWTVFGGSYADYDFSGVTATWFVDPPYEVAGRAYPCGSRGIDYAHLATWCRERSGQVIACEAVGAEWLPFTPLGGTTPRIRKASIHREAIWQK